MLRTYRTSDTYIASYLLALGYENYHALKDGKVIYFVFEEDDEKAPKNVFELEVEQYYQNNSLLSPKKLFNAYTEIKTRIAELLNKNKYG